MMKMKMNMINRGELTVPLSSLSKVKYVSRQQEKRTEMSSDLKEIEEEEDDNNDDLHL